MPTADGKPTKTNDEIRAETNAAMNWLAAGPKSDETQMLTLIYERLGDIWLWLKERR